MRSTENLFKTLRETLTRRRTSAIISVLTALFVIATIQAAEPQSDSARERAFATRELGERGGADAVAPLIVALGDANVFVRATAMQALHNLGDGELHTTVIAALMAALDDENSLARAGAAETLGMLNATAAAASLTRLLGDSDPAAQHAAACALARLDATAAVAALIALARDAAAMPFARMGAAWALGELKAQEAVLPLLDVIEGGRRGEWNYTSVTVYAVEALGKINDPASVPRLVEAMAVEDRYLRAQLAATLEQMTGQNFGQDQDRWKDFLKPAS